MSSMFSKLKEIKDLRQQAKSIQSVLAQESVEATAAWGKIKVKMNGNQEVQKVEINAEMMTPAKKSDLEKGLQEATNDAIKKVQKIMAEKIRAQGGLNIPGLTK
ncbi:MAG: YbaB/EbfC family nucleoid-associated protein [Candidatus Kerfeldbacteria bacterium]|nr:YbaB/EbfC family nucleoid-associated protein [Candidatus Kerfeldbacteria bacterium]